MTPPVWVPVAAVIIIHDRQISRHGGAPGLRDRALLEMGCARAVNRAAYASEADLAEIAAAYAFGIVKAHAFVDGNKRTGFVTALTFLRLNGYGFRPDPILGVRMMEGLATGEVDETVFAAWLAAHWERI
ncbi:MAG: type II toxin-antitoxin system death-on-curing family toxin [Maritimibacter sp.]|nr:type II toxin-antitoxin system death-on-curing family toxin [Maritimibacter sp.]